MNHRLAIAITAALLLASGSALARITTDGHHRWKSSAKTEAQLRKFGAFSPRWHKLRYKDLRLLIAVETWPTDGISIIDIAGYVYNEQAKEWRRFCLVSARRAFHVRLTVETASGMLRVLGAANNDLRGKTIFSWNLNALVSR